MTNEVHNLTPTGRIKKPSYSLVCSWIKIAWEKINPSLIRKSFKCCGISIKTDGTEDDEIFDYNNLTVNENKENNEFLEEENKEENEEENNYDNWKELGYNNSDK
jgi:hypothetical protein